jgi:hypothetical protein
MVTGVKVIVPTAPVVACESVNAVEDAIAAIVV